MSDHFDRHNRTKQPWIIGFNAQGRPIYMVYQLPEFSNLDRVIVGENHIEINSWVFPYEILTRGVLQWLQRHFLEWMESDLERREWIEGIVEAFSDQAAKAKH